MLKKIFAISAVTVASVTTLAACSGGSGSNGGGDEASKFVGQWKCKSMEADGQDMGSMMEALGVKLEESITMDIKDNGTYEMKMSAMGEEEGAEGTWEISGNDTIVMKEKESNTETKGKIEGSDLVVEETGSKIVFTK